MRLTYRAWDGAGPPILMLHGLSSSATTWDQVARHLAPRHRVVALNQRGHGGSEVPEDGYDFSTIVDDAREICARLQIDRALVVGQSWGGNVAVAFGASADSGAVRGLVLVDGGFLEPSRGMTWEEAQERLRPPNIDMPLDQFRERLRERLGSLWTEEWEEATLANFRVDGEGIVRRHLPIETHMKIVYHLYRHRPSAEYAMVRAPMTFVVAIPPGADRGAPRLATAREVIAAAERADPRAVSAHWLENTVHDVQLQRPELLAEIILRAAQEGEGEGRA
ncbi:MAG: alpha/beta hydrolase [Chloroflexi bacterium]|nr:alpha/beta hydrolase [Chloroflexota bacterium]